MREELSKEYDKLGDLQFEYNIINRFAKNEDDKKIAKMKVAQQLAKIEKMEKEMFKEPPSEEKEQDE